MNKRIESEIESILRDNGEAGNVRIVPKPDSRRDIVRVCRVLVEMNRVLGNKLRARDEKVRALEKKLAAVQNTGKQDAVRV